METVLRQLVVCRRGGNEGVRRTASSMCSATRQQNILLFNIECLAHFEYKLAICGM